MLATIEGKVLAVTEVERGNYQGVEVVLMVGREPVVVESQRDKAPDVGEGEEVALTCDIRPQFGRLQVRYVRQATVSDAGPSY